MIKKKIVPSAFHCILRVSVCMKGILQPRVGVHCMKHLAMRSR